MDPLENSEASPETSSANGVPPGNPPQTAEQINRPQTGETTFTPPPPPGATLVVEGEVTDEKALAIQRREQELEERERKARETEMSIAERERKTQEREEALRQPVTTQPAVKQKRKRNWSDPVICAPEIEVE
jgi:hypothetical protein